MGYLQLKNFTIHGTVQMRHMLAVFKMMNIVIMLFFEEK